MKQPEHIQEEKSAKSSTKEQFVDGSFQKKSPSGSRVEEAEVWEGGGGKQGSGLGQEFLGVKQNASLALTGLLQGGHPSAAGGMGNHKGRSPRRPLSGVLSNLTDLGDHRVEVTGVQMRKGDSEPREPAKSTFPGIQARAPGAKQWQPEQRCRHRSGAQWEKLVPQLPPFPQ